VGRWASAWAVCLALAACTDGGFDWRGTEASVGFSWTIDRETPTAGTCAALAGTRVRLVVRAGAGRFEVPDFAWSCDSGSAATGAEFSGGTHDFGLELLDPLDRVVAWAAWERRTLLPGRNDLGNIDLAVSAAAPDARLTATWTVSGAPATEASCAAAGGETVRLDWRIGTLAGVPFTFPCAAGSGRTPLVLRSGIETDFRLRLLDADGYAVAQAPRRSWHAAVELDPGDNALGPLDLGVAGDAAPLAVILWWQNPAYTTPVFESCEAAGVDRFGWRLESGAGTVVDEASWETAPLPCTGYLSWPSVPADTYTLVIDGADGSGERAWSAECWGLEASDPEDNSYQCRVPLRPAD
jgi:hypothetical protein